MHKLMTCYLFPVFEIYSVLHVHALKAVSYKL